MSEGSFAEKDVLAELLMPWVGREAWSDRVYEWHPDEAAAYRDNGGFTEGRIAAEKVRAARVAEALIALGVRVTSHRPEAPMPEADYDALVSALREMPDRMAEAWGGNTSWLTTGASVAEVVRDWLTETIEEARPCPGDLPEIDECLHDWLPRPESDTWECLICGAER